MTHEHMGDTALGQEACSGGRRATVAGRCSMPLQQCGGRGSLGCRAAQGGGGGSAGLVGVGGGQGSARQGSTAHVCPWRGCARVSLAWQRTCVLGVAGHVWISPASTPHLLSSMCV